MAHTGCGIASRRSAVYSNDSILPADPEEDSDNEECCDNNDGVESDETDEELDVVLQEVEVLAEEIAEEVAVEEEEKKNLSIQLTGVLPCRQEKSAKAESSEALRAAAQKAVDLHKYIWRKRIALNEGRFLGTITHQMNKKGGKIPKILYYCIHEIESRDMENGLWRMPGCPSTIKKLKRKYIKGEKPNLGKYDVHVLTGAVLSYLQDLDEPLVPKAWWEEFIVAGSMECEELRVNLIKFLLNSFPKALRNVFALLIGHFQWVSKSPDSMMPLANFARLMGPLIIGYSSPDKEEDEKFPVIEAMYALLLVPPEFFKDEC